MKIELKLSISRPSNGGISIRIEDKLSGIEFLDASISLEEFSEAITGLASRPMQAEIRGLQYIGKKRIREDRKIKSGIDTYDTKILKKWLIDNAQEEGWILDLYLNSQSSVNRNDNGTFLNYSVYKYVDVVK